MNPYFRLLVIAWAGLCCRVVPAAEPEVRSSAAAEINQANALLRTGEIDGALQRYQAIQPPDALRPSLEYNQAVALYRKQDYAAAAELFSLAAGASESQIAGPSHYNLGNCRYAQGLGLAQQDKAAAIAKLQEAIAHYRDALRSLPHDADARANIELAAQLIDQLTKAAEQSQPEQSQPDQSQPDQSQQKQDQSAEQKQDQSEEQKSQSEQQPPQQDSPSQSEQQQDSQPQDSQQQDSGAQPGQQENQGSQGEEQNAGQSPSTDEDSPQPSSDDASADEATDQASPSSKEPASQNASAKDRPQDPQAEATEPTQPEKTSEDAPQSASGQLTAADSDENQDAAASSKALREISADESVMSHEEAMKMLQAIRDRDMLRRFQLRQRDSTRQVPVDRDW